MFGNAEELTQDWFAHPHPGGTVTDPTGHVSGRYTYHQRGSGNITVTTPQKVKRGCTYYATRIQCELHDRNSFTVDRLIADRAGLRVVRVAP